MIVTASNKFDHDDGLAERRVLKHYDGKGQTSDIQLHRDIMCRNKREKQKNKERRAKE